MSSEAKRINTDTVSQEDLEWMPRLGIGFHVPPGCLGCEILTSKRSAEARGMTVIVAPGLGGTPTERYFPLSKTPEVEQELRERVNDATSGACKFILHQACWRVEQVEE